jgi:hypothetical protein
VRSQRRAADPHAVSLFEIDGDYAEQLATLERLIGIAVEN